MNVAGTKVAFGVRPEWAEAVIFDVPINASVVRRRFRARDFAQAFVKADNTVTRHYLALAEGGLKLMPPVGMNCKPGGMK